MKSRNVININKVKESLLKDKLKKDLVPLIRDQMKNHKSRAKLRNKIPIGLI